MPLFRKNTKKASAFFLDAVPSSRHLLSFRIPCTQLEASAFFQDTLYLSRDICFLLGHPEPSSRYLLSFWTPCTQLEASAFFLDILYLARDNCFLFGHLVPSSRHLFSFGHPVPSSRHLLQIKRISNLIRGSRGQLAAKFIFLKLKKMKQYPQ